MAHTDGKYCRVSYDFFELGWYLRLRRKHPNLMEKWYWLVRLAQDARASGRIITYSGAPRDHEDIALSWDRRSEDQDFQEWEAVLADLIADRDRPLVRDEEDGSYRIAEPRMWYRPPSDDPAAVAERQQRKRSASRGVTTGNEASRGVTTGNEASRGVTTGNEASRPVTAVTTKPKPEPKPEPEPIPSVGSPGEPDGRSAAVEDEAKAILAELEDRDLHPAETRKLRAILATAHPPPVQLAALREAVDSVRTAVGVEVPIAVALARARDRLGRASPRTLPRPDPWANPPEPPAYARQKGA